MIFMKENKGLIIYLAGPVSNCNSDQINGWRNKIKKSLSSAGHKFINPAEHTAENWSPELEMVEIEKSDVVIANLWKESIGTVVGILQANKKGKPLVLIDPNFINSGLLKTIIGQENVVRTIEEACDKITNQILPSLNMKIWVSKKTKEKELFDIGKLKRSLNRLCADATVLPELIAKNVLQNIRKKEYESKISTEMLKQLIFEQIQAFCDKKDRYYTEEFKVYAQKLKITWENNEKKKDPESALNELEIEQNEKTKKFLSEAKVKNEKIEELERQVKRLSAIAEAGQTQKGENDAKQLNTEKYTHLDLILKKALPRIKISSRLQKLLLTTPHNDLGKLFYLLSLLNMNKELPKSCEKQPWHGKPSITEIKINDRDRIFYTEANDQITIYNITFNHIHQK